MSRFRYSNKLITFKACGDEIVYSSFKKNSCYFLVFLFQGEKLCKHTLPSFRLILQGLWKTESVCTFVLTVWKFFTNTAVLTTPDSQLEEMNSVLQTPLTRVAPTKAMPDTLYTDFPIFVSNNLLTEFKGTVLASFKSTWQTLMSSERKDPQLRKCLHSQNLETT